MKHYLITRPDGAKAIETRTHAPEQYIAELSDAQAQEPPEALEVETFTDEMGNEQRRVVVNELKRSEALERKRQDDEKRAASEKARDERKARLGAIDWASINTVAELKAIVKDLVDDPA